MLSLLNSERFAQCGFFSKIIGATFEDLFYFMQYMQYKVCHFDETCYMTTEYNPTQYHCVRLILAPMSFFY